jgi:hypothetical protein
MPKNKDSYATSGLNCPFDGFEPSRTCGSGIGGGSPKSFAMPTASGTHACMTAV